MEERFTVDERLAVIAKIASRNTATIETHNEVLEKLIAKIQDLQKQINKLQGIHGA